MTLTKRKVLAGLAVGERQTRDFGLQLGNAGSPGSLLNSVTLETIRLGADADRNRPLATLLTQVVT